MGSGKLTYLLAVRRSISFPRSCFLLPPSVGPDSTPNKLLAPRSLSLHSLGILIWDKTLDNYLSDGTEPT